MTQELVLEIASKTLYFTLLISAPILLTGLIIGLLVSLFQTVTQIREATLTFIPKITAVLLILLFILPWILNKFIDYFHYIMNIVQLINK